MKKINEKGFMISTLIYGIFIIFIIILSALIVTLNYRKNAFSNIEKPNGEVEVPGSTPNGEKGPDSVQTPDDDQNSIVVDNSGCHKPKIAEGLIPITYNGTTWVKADSKNKDFTWYNCSEKRYANAATVSKEFLEDVKNLSVGEEVSGINAMFVWVPRFQYKMTAKAINDFSFITINEIPKSDFNVPPGFRFGIIELTGFWVGKFETTGGLTPKILPNSKSTSGFGIDEVFDLAKKFTTTDDYGLSSEDFDSHLMKNSEWAAVAYLSASTYGKRSEIYINNSNPTITGQSAGEAPPIFNSNGPIYNYDDYNEGSSDYSGPGPGASHTGNIFGIYDMSGGLMEYVMGNLNGKKLYLDPSSIDDKYYDKFEKNDATGDTGLGQATYETKGKFDDICTPIFSLLSPWLARGGNYANTGETENAGIFSYQSVTGAPYQINIGYRVVLTPLK